MHHLELSVKLIKPSSQRTDFRYHTHKLPRITSVTYNCLNNTIDMPRTELDKCARDGPRVLFAM
jgi:hypothetical protein